MRVLLKNGGINLKYGVLGKIGETPPAYPIPYATCYSDSLYNAIQPYIKACWNFDKNLTSDSAGSNTLTNNGVTAGVGKNNGGASFNGSSSYLNRTVNTGDDLSPTTAFTASFWVNLNDYPSAINFFTFFSKFNPSIGGLSFSFSYYLNAGVKTLFYYVIENDGYIGITYSFPITLVLETWHHFCLVVGCGESENQIGIYLNGENIGINQEYNKTIATGDSANFMIGAQYDGWASYGYLNGKMDEVLFLKDYALSQSQITELYNSGLGKFYRTKSHVVAIP